MKYVRESEFIEFKESLTQLNKGLESLTAMLNKHGKGTILFGVNDKGNVIGVSVGNKTLKDISDNVNRKIKPTVVPTITEEKINGKVIIRLEASGHNKPYSTDGKYLIRSGNENKKVEPEVMKQLLFSNSIELITNIESFDQDLSFTQLKQLYISHNLSINDTSFEKNQGLLTKDGKYNLLASILSDNNNCSIKVVKFMGTDKSEMISRNEYGYKCLILAMQNALEYVQSLNETRVNITGKSSREEIHLFDPSSLREAWNNACLHTKWDRMVPPCIYIFSDRMEIISTGGLPIDYSKEDFYKGVSNPINKQLQKIMGQLGLVEHTGHGVPEIIKHYGKEAFDITENHITVTFKFPFRIKVGESDYSSLNPSQRKVLSALKNEPTITTDGLVKIVKLQTARIAEIIRELKELGIIERIGSNKTGYWKVK